MNIRDINRYNGRLGDARGRNPHGQPVYRWMHSTDDELRYPARAGIGRVEWLRQLDYDRWAIAMWYPSGDEGRWRQMFPDLAYPHQGMYYVTDVILAAGVEPNDTITEDAIGKLKKRDGKTFAMTWTRLTGAALLISVPFSPARATSSTTLRPRLATFRDAVAAP
jgi:hypothetical protein